MSAELAGSEKKAERLVSAIVATMSLIRDTFTGRLTFGRVDIGTIFVFKISLVYFYSFLISICFFI